MGKELDEIIAQLSDEIRRYPTPIARCDEQLTGLIERRAALLAERERAAERAAAPACTPENIWNNDGGFNAA
jgi:hypothetical protein